VESPLPRLFPWLKPGISNSLVLYGMTRISIKFGIALVLIRTILSGLVLGILFSPASLLSMVGGVTGAIMMAIGIRWFMPVLSLNGISVLGALINNLAQLLTVQFLFAGKFPIWFSFSVIIWIAIPSGIIVAQITEELLRRVE
ncbi:Gx transporter family protein, partial [bacterium]|nr:Gx transporter family protein [bacterium]